MNTSPHSFFQNDVPHNNFGYQNVDENRKLFLPSPETNNHAMTIENHEPMQNSDFFSREYTPQDLLRDSISDSFAVQKEQISQMLSSVGTVLSDQNHVEKMESFVPDHQNATVPYNHEEQKVAIQEMEVQVDQCVSSITCSFYFQIIWFYF